MSSLSSSLARKTQQILETKIEDGSFRESLVALSNLPLPEDSTSRSLQTTIENGTVQCADQLLILAEGISNELQKLQKGVAELQTCSSAIQNELHLCSNITTPYLESIEEFKAAQRRNQEKEKMIDDFLDKYQLTSDEIDLLQTGPIDDKFFEALQRSQKIYSNCRGLLRTNHQGAGLDIMDSMANYQEAAMNLLAQWVQSKCQGHLISEAAEMDPLLRRSLQALAARPVRYRHCAEEVAETRHDSLFEKFVGSLSRGPRPIEMQSDDPKRYINDMLAWVHQALASEIELLEMIFGDVAKTAEGSSKDLPSIAELLNKIFHSIDRPVKVRIEQVLMTPPDPVLCFELASLLEFYTGTMTDLSGGQFVFVASLQSCLDMALRTLNEQISSRGSRLIRNSIVIPRDLSPPPEVTETIHFLMQLINANAKSLRPAAEGETAVSLSQIAIDVIDPLVQACRKSADELESGTMRQGDPVDIVVSRNSFMINCLEALVSSTARQPALSIAHWKKLKEEMDIYVEELASEVSKSVLERCGLDGVLNRMEEYRSSAAGGTVMAADPSLSLEKIKKALSGFFELISSPDALPDLSAIIDVDLKHLVMTKISSKSALSYEMVFNALREPGNGFGTPEEINRVIEYSLDDVKTVLSLD